MKPTSENLLYACAVSVISERADYHCRTLSRARMRAGPTKRGHVHWVSAAINSMAERGTGDKIGYVY
jgi:hypothetical protein